MRSVLLIAAAVVAASLPGDLRAAPRPFSIDDLLVQEGLGGFRIDPSGEVIAVEIQAPYDTAATYDYGVWTRRLLSRIELWRPDGETPFHTLEGSSGEAGYVAGPFSPDGSRMVVYELTPDSWRLGFLEIATKEVLWTGVTPEWIQFGQSVAWRSNDEVVAIARPDGDLPIQFRVFSDSQEKIAALWETSRSGHGAGVTELISGVDRDRRVQSPPSRIVLVDARSGRLRSVADGEWFDLALSPDGRFVAALENAEDLQPSLDRPVTVGAPMRRRRLHIVDLSTGAHLEPRPDLDFAMYLMAWAPGSDRLLAFARPAGADAFEDAGDYYLIDPRGGADRLALDEARPFIHHTWDDIPVPLGSWVGPHPVIQVRRKDGARVWRRVRSGGVDDAPVIEPLERLADLSGQAAVIRSDGVHPLFGSKTRRALGRVITTGDQGDAGHRGAFNPSAQESGDQMIWRDGCLSSLDGTTEPSCFPGLAATARIVAASPNGNVYIAQTRAPSGATALSRITQHGRRDLIRINRGRADLAWGDVVPVPHSGPAGEPLTSWLLTPSDPTAGPPPVVIVIYPGSAYAAAPSALTRETTQLQNNPAILAAAGYAVLIASLPHPPDGRADAGLLVGQLDEIVEEAASLGLIDTERMALLGHSYGGYGALRVLTKTKRFRAAVVSNGFADLSRSLEPARVYTVSPADGLPIGPMVGWGETGQASIGDFTADPQAFVDASPLYSAKAITTPLLMVETDLDRPRYLSLFSALYRLGREARLVTYYGEGHTLASPGNLKDLHARILTFLDRHLTPREPTDPSAPMTSPGLKHGGDEQTIEALLPDEPLR